MTPIPRSIEEVLDQADELSARFENWEPSRAGSERHLTEAVRTARAAGRSWAAIGTMVGTSGEAAR